MSKANCDKYDTLDEVDPWYDTGLFCLEFSLLTVRLGGATGTLTSDSVSVAVVSSIASSSKSSSYKCMIDGQLFKL